MRKAAKGILRLAVPFDCLLTSPLLRARQTAEVLARALAIEDRLEEISGLSPESTVEHLLFGLARYQDRKHLLMVGHEPLLSNTALIVLRAAAGRRLESTCERDRSARSKPKRYRGQSG